jgi:protein SCO1/2
MEPAPHRPAQTVWIGIILVGLILGGAFIMSRPPAPPLPVLGQVADFTLTNQLGQPITLGDLRGKVWVADIIFTRCPGPCARMTRQMAEVQAELPARSTTKLISLTTDPEFDTPPVLQQYANRFKADPVRWHFLTGTKLGIAALAIDSLKLTTVEIPPEKRTNQDDLFIHSTIFILVDQRGQLRGIFETGDETAPWLETKAKLLAAIKQLERER